mgnify:FL=1
MQEPYCLIFYYDNFDSFLGFIFIFVSNIGQIMPKLQQTEYADI